MKITGKGFKFEMTLDAEVTRLRALSRHLEDATPTVLTAMGVQAVSWAVQDFREKSNGGSAGGNSWQPISLSGARTRLAGRKDYQKDSKDLLALHNEQQAARKKKPRDEKAIRGIQKKRQTIKRRRKREIEREQKNAKTGIDTGRLVNSLVYGVAPLEQAIKVPKGKASDAPREALTRAAFDISGNQIRVGSNMKYAGYFDEKRPIFGPSFMDGTRRESMDRLIEKTIDIYIAKKVGA